MSWTHRLGNGNSARGLDSRMARKRRTRFTASLQGLEERVLLSFNTLPITKVSVFTQPVFPETFLVTNNQDIDSHGNPVAGSLRAAIVAANAHTGTTNTIDFKIGSGVQTIALKTALPRVTNPVKILGSTQPGYAGRPLIVLNGAGAGSGAVGLDIQDGHSTVNGLAIDGFGGDGIQLVALSGLFGASDDVVDGNYIGVDATGTVARGNGGDGVDILGASGNTIGGTTVNSGNVISGNRGSGIAITDVREVFPPVTAVASGNVVEGNLIGTNAAGTAALPNKLFGVTINSAPGNTVGSTSTAGRNVISGNSLPNLSIIGASSTGNMVEGNFIGTNVSGTAALSAASAGVYVVNGASNNKIGGTAAGAGNLISGNGGGGVDLDSAGTAGNAVAGNLIGTDYTGTRALPNSVGVSILDNAFSNTIGGTAAAARNVISGNSTAGVEIGFSSTFSTPGTPVAGDVVEGNYIGTDYTGTKKLGNAIDGVLIQQASFNTIGGLTAGERNVISGNGVNGVRIVGVSTSSVVGNVVEGDYIGTTASGTVALGNGNGVFLDAFAEANTIGGTAPGATNVLSGNGSAGVSINTNALGNNVLGNLIGTDVTGAHAVANDYGVFIQSGSNMIGGTTAAARNVISGNSSVGVFVYGFSGNASSNQVYGNYIGTAASGQTPLPNANYGVIVSGALGTVIGNGAPGAGNVISGNAGVGVELDDAQSTTVEGNLIGANATDLGSIPNSASGVVLNNSSECLIGGTRPGAGNTIAFNNGFGVWVQSGSGNAILSNSIFLDAAGGILLSPPSANQLQDAPALTSAVSSGGSTTVAGSLQGTAGSTYLIQFFSTSFLGPFASGEGQTLIGSITVTVPAGTGSVSFSQLLSMTVPTGQFVAATATNVTVGASDFPVNNTSQFSNAVKVS